MDNTNNTKKINPAVSVVLKLILTLAAAAVIAFGGSLVILLLVVEGVTLALCYMAGWIMPSLLLPAIWLKKRKKYVKVWLMATILCCVAIGVNIAMVKHDESITIDTSSYVRVRYYLPFEEDSLIVKEESKTLKLTDNRPVMDGADALYPVFSAFVNSIYTENPSPYGDESIMPGDNYAYHNLAEGTSEIVFDLHYPDEDQKAYADSLDADFEYTTVGTEALVFIVHKDNPVDSLTSEQLKAIYSGEITNWEEVGGKNKKIDVYQSDSESQAAMESFMGDTPLMPPAMYSYNDIVEGKIVKVADYRNKESAIGFCYNYCIRDNDDVKVLSIDGAAPTQENIENGSYYAVVPIIAATRKGNTNENVDKVLEWVLSEEGKHIIKETGYFDVVDNYLN